MVAGLMLLYGFYRDQARSGSLAGGEGKLEHFGEALLRQKKPIGIACMAIAALHFLFPYALFL